MEYTYDYDLNGKLKHYEGPSSNFSETVYNEIGKPKEVITPNGRTIYEYDHRGNLIKTTYPDGSSQQTEYDAGGQSIKSWDRDGNMVQNVYDKAGRITLSAPPLVKGQEGTCTETRYDGAGRVTSRFDERRNETRYFYGLTEEDQQRRIVTNAGGVSTISSHDESGRLIRTEHARLNEDLEITELFDTIRYEYDGYGQQTKTIFIDSNGAESAVTTEYDHAGRKIAEIDQADKRTGFDYDEAGRLISVTDHLGHTTYYEYDKTGNRTRQIDAEKRATVMEYNDLGQLVKRYMPCQLESIDDECQADLYETFDYNIQGSMISHTDFNGETTYYDYDSNNRLITKTLPYSIFGVTASADGMYANCMFKLFGQPDSGGNYNCEITCTHQSTTLTAIQIVTEGGAIACQLSDTTSGAVNTWLVAAKDVDDLVAGEYKFELVDPAIAGGKMSANIIGIYPKVEYHQTPAGVQTQTGQTTYEHDPRGRLVKEIKPTGQVIRYEYNRTSNRTRVAIYPDEDSDTASSDTTYAYDKLNRITDVNDITTAGIQTTRYTYDDVGNLETVTYPNAPVGIDTWSTKYTYDYQHRLTNVLHRFADPNTPSNVTVHEYVYTIGGAGNRTKVEEYKYDEEESRESTSPTRTVDYVYDDLYRLTKEIVTTAADGWTRTDTYTYDDVGNRETMVRQTPTEQITTIYTYNEKDQLETETQIVLQADGGTYAATPTPKRSAGIALAAIASISFTGLLIPFLLLRTSTGGKRVRRNRRFIAAVSAFFIPLMAVDPTTVYALQNESLAYLALVTAGAATTDPDTTIIQYQYDNNGNTIEKTTTGQAGNSTTTYTYDSENHLIKLDKNLSPQSITTYTYDTEGIRTSQQTGTERTTYTTDKNRPYAQVLEERNESNQLTKRYTYGHDLISQTTNPNQAEESIKYFHYDGQMSTRTLTEGNPAQEMFRQITDTYTYDAFGNTTTKTGATDNQYKYTGEQYDVNAGFYYLRARYYNPFAGRFVSRDSYGGNHRDPVSLHRYLYTGSNPIGRFDPSGRETIVGVMLALGIFSILASALLPVIHEKRQR